MFLSRRFISTLLTIRKKNANSQIVLSSFFLQSMVIYCYFLHLSHHSIFFIVRNT